MASTAIDVGVYNYDQETEKGQAISVSNKHTRESLSLSVCLSVCLSVSVSVSVSVSLSLSLNIYIKFILHTRELISSRNTITQVQQQSDLSRLR